MSKPRRPSSITGLIVLAALILFVLTNTNPALVQGLAKNLPNWNQLLPDLSKYIPNTSPYLPDLSKYLPTGPNTQPAANSNTPNGFPALANKPAPQEITFHDCPPDGDGGDAELNRNKNRVDDAAQYLPVSLDTMLTLSYPSAIGNKQRKNWSAADASAVAQYEGTPVVVEGYLIDSKPQGPESTNCHSTVDVDFHIWLATSAGADKTNALIVEMTPRVRVKHPGWASSKLERLDNTHPLVRVSGWVMMDQEHPEQLGKTRGTLWEIHPVMQFQVGENGQWVALDDVQ